MAVQTRPEESIGQVATLAARRPSGIARLYGLLHRWAESGWAEPAVGLWAFLQSSVVPGPADAVFVPLGIADPPKVWRLAAWASACALIGGIVAYFIGATATTETGRALLAWLHVSPDMLQTMSAAFAKYGWLFVFFGAFGPISTKLTCFTAGMLAMPLPTFILALGAGRTIRFFSVAALLHAGGERLESWLRRKGGVHFPQRIQRSSVSDSGATI